LPSSPEEEHARAVADEERRARILRMVVDLVTNVIAQGSLTRAEAEQIVEAARRRILELFPDREQTYEIVLAPRFSRLLDEYAPGPAPRRKLLPFRQPR
jgi:hypothetical protein